MAISGVKASLARLAASLVSGALIALSSGLHPFWPAAWIAPVPVLIAAFASRGWTGFVLAFLAGAIGVAPMAVHILEIAPPFIVALLAGLIALALSVGVSLATAARGRLPAWLAVLAYPAWTAGIETLNLAFSADGTAGSLAYSQMDFTPALQVAAFGGAPAVSFVVALFVSGLAFLIADLVKPARGRIAAATAGLIVAASLAWGAIRPGLTAATPTITVALAALDQQSELPSDWRAVLDAYQPRLDEARAKGARVLVLPEEIAVVPERDVDSIDARLSTYSRASGVTLALGFRIVGAARKGRNRLLVFIPDGRVIGYDKRHLIQGLESVRLTPGTGPVLAAGIGGVRFGGSICKDYDFVDTSRRLAAAGAQIALAPAWDFGADGWLHGRMAMLRAIEGGFTLIRSARNGVMSVSDRYGQVLAERPSGVHAPLLLAKAPVPSVQPPLYARIGDVFGWACLALTVLILILTRLRRPLPPSSPEGALIAVPAGRQIIQP
jgi:apolipoprotein N-acyltransferase